MSGKIISQAQYRVLRYIYLTENGSAPHAKEAAKACVVPHASLTTHLQLLVKKGYLQNRERETRYGLYYSVTNLGMKAVRNPHKFIKVFASIQRAIPEKPSKMQLAQERYRDCMLASPRNYAGPKARGVAM